MKEKIICFSLGLSEDDREKGKTSFYGSGSAAPVLEIIALTGDLMNTKTGDALKSMIAGAKLNGGEKKQSSEKELIPGESQYRIIMINASERGQVLQIVRNFKAVLPDPQNIIFAVITDAARTWTFAEYIEHLAAEHEYMKNRKPGDNPDLKKL